MVPPTGTQTEQGNLSQKRCDLKNVGFGGGTMCIYIYGIHNISNIFETLERTAAVQVISALCAKKALLLLASRVRTANVPHAQKIDPCAMNTKLTKRVNVMESHVTAVQ